MHRTGDSAVEGGGRVGRLVRTPAVVRRESATAPGRPGRPSRWRRLRRTAGDHLVTVVAVLVLLYLFLPVAYTFVFSFNDYRKSNLVWQSFTTKHWTDPCGAPGACESLTTSLQVGVISTLIATVLGTMIAFALVRHRFTGRRAVELLVFLPMATPEVVLGASLLTILVQGFARVGLGPGFAAVVAAHVMFCVSFVVVTVKARLRSLDWRLEEAAMDLYAGPRDTFTRVTLPLAMPGIVGGALLSFALSFDDFIITNFVSGEVMTFPRFVYVSYLRGIPAQANVIGFALFALAVLATAVPLIVRRLRRRGAGRA